MELTFEGFALTGYGKFSKQSKYPYLVWEPSDQAAIGKISSIYVKHALHEPAGLRFAINISPERFQVFNAQYSGTAWNVQLRNTANLRSPFAFPGGANKNEIIVFAWNTSCSCVVSSRWAYETWFSPTITMVAGSHPVGGAGAKSLKSLQSVVRVNDTSFLACDYTGTSTIITTGPTSTTSGPKFISGGPNASRVFWSLPQGYTLQATPDCPLEIWSAAPDFVPSCFFSGGNTTAKDASLALIENGNFALSWADSTNAVFVAISLSNGSLVGVSRIGVGTSATLSYEGGSLLVTTTDSFCWNTETNNKEVVNVCSMQPTSCPGVLSYWYGPVSNWQQALASPPPNSFTACDANIAHGAFDNGSSGRSLLFLDPFTSDMRLLEVHVGATNATQCPSCGLAIPYEGLVLDSFDIAKYNFAPL